MSDKQNKTGSKNGESNTEKSKDRMNETYY